MKLKDEGGFLSNFYPAPFIVDGNLYKTSEHYYQSKKFLDKRDEQAIIDCPGPWSAAEQGRSPSRVLREDWESIKDSMMMEAIRHKFSQNPGLKNKLMDTQDAELIEHSKSDKYWADGGDGSGQNKLGQLLMKLREEFYEEENKKS